MKQAIILISLLFTCTAAQAAEFAVMDSATPTAVQFTVFSLKLGKHPVRAVRK